MERLSDTAIEIINELHTERLDYSSEYIPLIDAASRLAAYEDTGMEPEEINDMALEVATLKTIESMYDGLGKPDHIRDLIQAEQDGRLHITPAFVWHNGDSGLHEVPYKPWMAKWISTGTKFWWTREEAEAALAQKGGKDHA